MTCRLFTIDRIQICLAYHELSVPTRIRGVWQAPEVAEAGFGLRTYGSILNLTRLVISSINCQSRAHRVQGGVAGIEEYKLTTIGYPGFV